MSSERRRLDGKIISIIEKIAKKRATGLVISELERIAYRAGVDEKEVFRVYVEAKNAIYTPRFLETPYEKRILFLPQCLRKRTCKAEFTEDGYVCQECGACGIAEVKKLAESLGYRVYIAPGGSLVEKIFQRERPKACLGVACWRELVLGSIVAEKYGVAACGHPLLRDGCFETDVDYEALKRLVRARA